METLQNTLAQYRLVLEKIKEIEQALDNFQVPIIERLTKEFNCCMDKAREADSILESNPVNRTTDRENELQEERRQLVETVLRKIRTIDPRMQALRALQVDEMKQIKLGRQTASGYAQHLGSKTGRIINSSN